jgi:hypothetical protein
MALPDSGQAGALSNDVIVTPATVQAVKRYLEDSGLLAPELEQSAGVLLEVSAGLAHLVLGANLEGEQTNCLRGLVQ